MVGPVSLTSAYGHKEDVLVRSEVFMPTLDLNSAHLWFQDFDLT